MGRPTASLAIPESDNVVEVSIIDTTTDLVCPTGFFLEPVIVGQENLNLPTYSFLVQHKRLAKSLLFDLGGRKDWHNLAPATLSGVQKGVKSINVTHGVDEILKKAGVDLATIDHLVISHAHWDHIGDPSNFPRSSQLVVGPGLKSTLLSGYPAEVAGATLESDIAGREVREISFDGNLDIAGLRGFDFFGDGSFYLLHTPGHATGHMSALARTTKDTFIFMAGDLCHYAGSLRPSQSHPFPQVIDAKDLPGTTKDLPCPCSAFLKHHWDETNASQIPFYNITQKAESWFMSPDIAQKSLECARKLDAASNVFVLLAHDIGLRGVVPFFPHGQLNDWKTSGWKEESLWGFLKDFPT